MLQYLAQNVVQSTNLEVSRSSRQVEHDQRLCKAYWRQFDAVIQLVSAPTAKTLQTSLTSTRLYLIVLPRLPCGWINDECSQVVFPGLEGSSPQSQDSSHPRAWWRVPTGWNCVSSLQTYRQRCSTSGGLRTPSSWLQQCASLSLEYGRSQNGHGHHEGASEP